MIVVCEPQCKGFSHEKVNSGFLYGLRLAFPKETLRFYAEQTHINAIKEILKHDNVIVDDIEYIPISYRELNSITGVVSYFLLLRKLFNDVRSLGESRILFLSFSSVMLFMIKKLKQKSVFSDIKFTFVLHAEFEHIKPNDNNVGNSMPVKTSITKSAVKIIRNQKLSKIMAKLIKLIHLKIRVRVSVTVSLFLSRLFPIKKIIMWKHSNDYRYIVLSPHIINNAEKYIDIKNLNIFTVILPTLFVEPSPMPVNRYPKFGVFGYGNSALLSYIAGRLSAMKFPEPYEIRIIGMDNRGTAEIKNVVCPSPGKPLHRKEMEKYAKDIDMFLILYEKNRYQLSCSGSIMESLSYMKPILHLNNECINFFNQTSNRIGICCPTVDEYIDEMVRIIENYQEVLAELNDYRNNIINCREKYDIKNSVNQLRDSFTWPAVSS